MGNHWSEIKALEPILIKGVQPRESATKKLFIGSWELTGIIKQVGEPFLLGPHIEGLRRP